MNEDTRMQILLWAWTFGALPLLWLSVVLLLMTPFWRSVVGTHLLVKTLLLASILSFATLRRHLDEFPEWLEWTRWVIYMAFPPVILWRVILQIQGLRAHRDAIRGHNH